MALRLDEVQAQFAHALTRGGEVVAPLLGGGEPHKRLAIHERNYATSLVAALCAKYSATIWLAGADFFAAAAREFVRAQPPSQPCIAEYGESLPAFLASLAPALPYLQSFAELEWAAVQTSIAIDQPALEWLDVAAVGVERLLDCRVDLQPGTRYLRYAWNVDELLQTYLAGREPAQLVLRAEDVCIEMRGARGSLAMTRLPAAAYELRAALCAGTPLAAAFERALARNDAALDPGAALRDVVDAGLVTALTTEGDPS
jgi:hypothetical protein